VIRDEPKETILAQFHVDLRRLLDGDYHVQFTFEQILQQQIDALNQQIVPNNKKKDKDKDKERLSSSKSNKDKSKGFFSMKLFLFAKGNLKF